MNLDQAQIPDDLLMVERIHAWSGLLLHRANTTLKVLEAPNLSDYACQANVFTADDGTQRLVLRINLELDPNFASSGQKLWMQVKPFSNIAIPSGYL